MPGPVDGCVHAMRAQEGMGRVTASWPPGTTILLRAINRHGRNGQEGEANTWQG